MSPGSQVILTQVSGNSHVRKTFLKVVYIYANTLLFNRKTSDSTTSTVLKHTNKQKSIASMAWLKAVFRSC